LAPLLKALLILLTLEELELLFPESRFIPLLAALVILLNMGGTFRSYKLLNSIPVPEELELLELLDELLLELLLELPGTFEIMPLEIMPAALSTRLVPLPPILLLELLDELLLDTAALLFPFFFLLVVISISSSSVSILEDLFSEIDEGDTVSSTK
jgi:hypothetical protein